MDEERVVYLNTLEQQLENVKGKISVSEKESGGEGLFGDLLTARDDEIEADLLICAEEDENDLKTKYSFEHKKQYDDFSSESDDAESNATTTQSQSESESSSSDHMNEYKEVQVNLDSDSD